MRWQGRNRVRIGMGWRCLIGNSLGLTVVVPVFVRMMRVCLDVRMAMTVMVRRRVGARFVRPRRAGVFVRFG